MADRLVTEGRFASSDNPATGGTVTLPGVLAPGAQIPKLAFMRAFSAVIVIIFHTGYYGVPAGFGVLTFFVISGFLITHLLIQESELTGNISIRNFYVRRALRILPAFYVYWLVVVVGSTIFHDRIIWGQAICSLFYVSNYYQGLHNYPIGFLAHTWSLSVEEQFYLIWPGVVLLFLGRLRKLGSVLLIVIPAIWVIRAVMHLAGAPDAYIYTSFETNVDAILVGSWFAISLHTGLASRFVAEVSRARYLVPTLALLWASIVTNNAHGSAYRDIVGHAVDPVLLGMLIMQLISLRGAKWMDSRPINYLGKISYSTYLYQQMVHPTFLHYMLWLHRDRRIFLNIGVSWAVASVSYELVEKPFLRLKHRFSRTEDPVPAQTPGVLPSEAGN